MLTTMQRIKYGDKACLLHCSTESYYYELYYSSRANGDESLEFTSIINHNLIMPSPEDLTSDVDTALEQLKASMAAISELKEANKYVSLVFSDCPAL